MRLKYLFIGSVIGCTLLTACQDQLDYHEYSNYDKEYMMTNYKNVGGLVTNIYAQLDADWGNYGGAMLSSACDESEYVWTSSSVHDFYNGSWSASNGISSTWSKSYSAIQQCNMYLEEFLGLTFPELRLNSDYEAQMFRYRNYENEVRFLRAYFYFNLARQYGDVPLVTKVPSTDEVNHLTRTPVQEVFQFIQDECDAIVKKIPADYSKLGIYALPGNSENGRANRLAVLALKARTALYAASPLFNPEQTVDLWQKAAEANKAVIDSCTKYKYALNSYEQLWGADSYLNNEMIFLCRSQKESNTLEANNFPIGVEGGKGGNCPTQTLVDAYEMKSTGKLWNEKGSGYSEEPGSDPYADRDPRFYLTIAKNEDEKWPSYYKEPLQIYYGGVNGEPLSGATPTGYYLKKYCDASINLTASSSNKKFHSWITYRLGEFYLNYAEAIFRLTGAVDKPLPGDKTPLTAREAIDVIRTRKGVDMPRLRDEVLDPDVFWKRYKNERMVELAFEGHRFWDVRRWKEGDVLKEVTFMKITRNSNGTYTYTRQIRKRAWDDKMYLFPVPQSERLKNPNLYQNPGW